MNIILHILLNNNRFILDKGIKIFIQTIEPVYLVFSPSLDISSRYIDGNHNGTANLNDYRPASATSSVRSQDSGVAQSDPKTSIDCSAKSESSPKVSLHNSNNYYLSNNNPLKMGRHRLPSSESNQHVLMSQPEQVYDTYAEQIRDKLQPLNTQRLKTLRQATKSFIVSLLFSDNFISFPKKRKISSYIDEYYG